jgi:hypothetical protein
MAVQIIGGEDRKALEAIAMRYGKEIVRSISPEYGFFVAVFNSRRELGWASNAEREDVIAAMKKFIGEVEAGKSSPSKRI